MTKKDFGRARILFFSILLGFFLLLELEIMLNFSDNYFYLAVLTFLIIVSIYLLVLSILQKRFQEQLERDEKLDNIFKSEKASYLLLRKNFQELDERVASLEETIAPLPSVLQRNEKRIGQLLAHSLEEQKNISKITISRSDESVQPILDSNEILTEKISGFDESLNHMEARFIEELQGLEMGLPEKQLSDIGQEIKSLETKQQEVVTFMREMELSLKNEILEMVNKNLSMQQKAYMTSPAPVVSKTQEAHSIPEAPEIPEAAANTKELIMPEPAPASITEPEPDPTPDLITKPALDPITEPEPVPEPEPVAPPMPDLSDPNKVMSPDDIASLIANVGGSDPEPVPEPEPVAPPMPDLSDPNKVMSPDDIAALIANVGGSDPEPVPEPEPVAPPMPDLSDPNKVMSPDDIAALIANVGGSDLAPVPEPESVAPPMPDLSDPNKVMSPDDIAALIANVGGSDPEPVPEPESVAPPMPDLSDPNKVMSPDDIAALIANM